MILICFCIDFLIIDKINVYSKVYLKVGKFIFLLYLNYGYNNKNCIICNLKYIVEFMLSINNSI